MKSIQLKIEVNKKKMKQMKINAEATSWYSWINWDMMEKAKNSIKFSPRISDNRRRNSVTWK